MRKAILMSMTEPSDLELETLMKEVAVEAKRKAVIAERELRERIQAKLIALTIKR